jgi:N-acetyl-anhydromuramyl-L-alanine amidase AmpD
MTVGFMHAVRELTTRSRRSGVPPHHAAPAAVLRDAGDVASEINRFPAGEREWKYIVIHHSATLTGSLASMERDHIERRGWDGVGYHFIIRSAATNEGGKVEIASRWTKQQAGAHAGDAEYNEHGIGICLVGNFDVRRPGEAQYRALVILVEAMQYRFGIPDRRVFLHREIRRTECPGKHFPSARFRTTLAQDATPHPPSNP